MEEAMETDSASRQLYNVFLFWKYTKNGYYFSPKRSIKTLNDILSLAKLKETDILPTSQAIYFEDSEVHNCSEQYKFLEVDKQLANCLETGQILYIKGDDEENAVLCTEDKTYDLLECETSNSLLLVKGLQFNEDVRNETRRQIFDVSTIGVFYKYLSPIPGKPKLKKLKHLLNKTAYKGPEMEYTIKSEDLYTIEDLQSVIQASNEELKQTLKDLNTITINGKIRVLEFEYHFRVLSYMMKVLDENSLPYDQVDYEQTMDALEEIVPKEILNSLFDLYTEESRFIDGVQQYRYTNKVAKFFAQVLLANAGKFNFSEFLQAWQESVPDEMPTDESMLHGIAIIDRKANVIRYFPEDNLPENIVERFNVLFDAKDNWTAAEIVPYIQ